MESSQDLLKKLRRIDGRGYKAYQDLRGRYDFSLFRLQFDSIQGDPFAFPSRLSVSLDLSSTGCPRAWTESRVRQVAAGDFLGRLFSDEARKLSRGHWGTGHSGQIRIDTGGQEVLERSSVQVDSNDIEFRFTVGLPASGRRVLGRQAEEMLLHEIPAILEETVRLDEPEQARLRHHVETVEDQDYLRGQLESLGLVAFVANGCILPRRSGVDDRPLEKGLERAVIPFQSPAELEVTLETIHQGPIRGMGIPGGVTLIVGGGFHGKSTLLRALQNSVYDHIPGDGREMAVTLPSAVKIRAEDGRSIQGVDLSAFIGTLPYGKGSSGFSSQNASGSTSQAASILEALEAGTQLLLIDEDTSATNFMIRDTRMQVLVPRPSEPITPFIDRVQELHEKLGVSTVLVMGGSGDYLDVADQVILMESYRASDVTPQARDVVQNYPTRRQTEKPYPWRVDQRLPSRVLRVSGSRPPKIQARGPHTLLLGKTVLDLAALEQLVDASQTRAIGLAILQMRARLRPGQTSLVELVDSVTSELEKRGLDCLSHRKTGDLALPRKEDIAAALNRLRELAVKP